jgi:hypothetical protein
VCPDAIEKFFSPPAVVVRRSSLSCVARPRKQESQGCFAFGVLGPLKSRNLEKNAGGARDIGACREGGGHVEEAFEDVEVIYLIVRGVRDDAPVVDRVGGGGRADEVAWWLTELPLRRIFL